MASNNPSARYLLVQKNRIKASFLLIFGLVLLALLLALITNQFKSLDGWAAFFWMGLACTGLIAGCWWLLRAEKMPRWLLWLTIAAAFIRLGAGVGWFVLLPVMGHGTQAEVGGYVMGDAFRRDQAAWDLAVSNNTLLSAFQENRKVDQYGGLLFISAAVYRLLGNPFHQPLLMVMLGAAMSALAVPLGWAFSRRIWGDQAAKLTAWGVFLYPEAVLIGSSQMREAFTISLAAATFYGVARNRDDRKPSNLTWVLVPFLLILFVSALSAALVLGGLVLISMVILPTKQVGFYKHRWFWIAITLLVVLGLVGVWVALRNVVPERITNPIAMATWWLRKSANLQAFISRHSSGWMQKVYKSTPVVLQLPLLMAYGVVQPFLPAAIVAGSDAPIWRVIAIWRATGWTLLLAVLAFAPFHTWRKDGVRNLARMLTLIIWLVILISAFRGGSDMWDNPRYRAIYAVLQISLAAQVIIEVNHQPNPWFRRAILITGSILFWFLPWYLQRYYGLHWIINDPIRTLGVGILCGLLLIIGDLSRSLHTKKTITPAKNSDTSNIRVFHEEKDQQ